MNARHSTLRRGSLPASRGGGVLVLALVAVVTVAALTAAFLQMSTAVSRRQAQMRDRMQAFYMAEAGLAEGWTAVRVKKTGTVGTEAAPAVYGDGLFWVEATPLGGRLVRLESTGRVGSGSATLSLVVEEGIDTVADLGVYSPSAIDLPPGTVLDGYDSRLGYGADGALVAPSADELSALFESFLEQTEGLIEGVGGLSDASAPLPAPDRGAGEGQTEPSEEETEPEYPGRIASGGDITATGTTESPTVIRGDLVPGPEGSVTLTGDVEVTGETEPSATTVALPPIEVPDLPALSGVRHGGAAPLLMLPTEAHLPRLAIGADAEVIVQGPATLVIDSLILDSGARLYLDTTGGPVDIHVTTEAVFAESSRVSNSTEDPSDLTLQISASPAAPIALPAGGPIHGIVYAPDADLTAPAGFELFGSLVAGSITFAAPPRLHFDQRLVEVAHELSLPTQFSWRIVELETDMTGGAIADPFVLMGLDRSLLSAPARSHADQTIDVTYENGVGARVSYSGLESAFDWSLVTRVEELERGGRKVVGEEDTVATRTSIDPLVDLVQDGTTTSSDLRDRLLAQSPISKAALAATIDRSPAMQSSDLRDVLSANAPLGDHLTVLAIDSGTLSSSHLKDVLLSCSPGLTTVVLDAATGALSPADLLAVLTAQ